MIDAKRPAEMMEPEKLRGLAELLDGLNEARELVRREIPGGLRAAPDINFDALDCAAAVLREVAGRATVQVERCKRCNAVAVSQGLRPDGYADWYCPTCSVGWASPSVAEVAGREAANDTSERPTDDDPIIEDVAMLIGVPQKGCPVVLEFPQGHEWALTGTIPGIPAAPGVYRCVVRCTECPNYYAVGEPRTKYQIISAERVIVQAEQAEKQKA